MMKSLYWVFTLKCNDFCAHCYNNSGPKGESIDLDQLKLVIPNLPDQIGRLILSGGEPLIEWKKLTEIIRELKKRYKDRVPLYLQTNGDFLTKEKLKHLQEIGLERLDITSLDRFHKHKGSRADELANLMQDSGWINLENTPKAEESRSLRFKMWGANEDIWLGGNWARGRAMKNGHALLNPEHNFCSLWSGAKGFLGGESQEVHIQLYRLYPCCPTTAYSLGDVRNNSVESLLANASQEPAYQTLNKAEIESLGAREGLSKEFIQNRIQILGDVCLWCDEYFTQYYKGEKSDLRADLITK